MLIMAHWGMRTLGIAMMSSNPSLIFALLRTNFWSLLREEVAACGVVGTGGVVAVAPVRTGEASKA